MRHAIHVLVLAYLMTSVAVAAEREDITLRDGRHLTGIYDERSGSLTLDGGTATIAVAAADIVDREAAPLPKPKAPESDPAIAAAPVTEPQAMHSRPTGDTILAIIQDEKAAFEEEAKRDQQVHEEITAARRQRTITWLMHANLDKVAVPDVSSDPRRSEVDGKNRAELLNSVLQELRELRRHVLDERAAHTDRHYIQSVEDDDADRVGYIIQRLGQVGQSGHDQLDLIRGR